MIKKIILSGEGGHGIKLITNILGKVLCDMDYEIAITFDYDAAVRGGKIVGFIIFSDEGIENPIAEECDILIKLSNMGGNFSAKYEIGDTGLGCVHELAFSNLAKKKFGDFQMVNMIVLGRLFDILEIDIEKIKFEKYLPQRGIEKNIEAIKYGFSLK